jgi:murein DD-endopeptidase MepM/ murein hydrolase activator NlpD
VVRLFPARFRARATGVQPVPVPSPGPVRRPARRRTLAAATAIGLSFCLTVSAATADDLDDKKDKVEQGIDHAHQDLDESSEELQAATTALLQARSDLANAQAYLATTQDELAAAEALDAQMQQKLDDAVAALQASRVELKAGRRDVARQEAKLRRMVVASYQQGDPALMGLSMVFTTQDPAQLTGSVDARSSVANTQSAILDQLTAAKVLLQVKEDQTQSAKQVVAERRRAAAENLARKQALEQQARDAEAQVTELVGAREQAMKDALAAKKTDLATLEKLQAERDRIAQLIAQATLDGSGYTGPSTGDGALMRPVDGPVTSPFGWRTHPIWGYQSLHDGVDLSASCGTPIVAAADGTVISEYFQTAWGNRIIIDHGLKRGVSVSTISNHLSGYAVGVGDHVKQGQTVGYVGTTGWSTGCHLHFTVNENGTPVDPMGWF